MKMQILNQINAGRSPADVASKSGVQRMTVHTWIKNRDKIKKHCVDNLVLEQKCVRKSTSNDIARCLVMRITEMRKYNRTTPLSYGIIRVKAEK